MPSSLKKLNLNTLSWTEIELVYERIPKSIWCCSYNILIHSDIYFSCFSFVVYLFLKIG